MSKNLKKILNNNGSSLVWVAVSMVVLLILIGGILTMASVYHSTSVGTNNLNQAYLSARSAADSVVGELQTNPTGELATKIQELEVGKSLSLGDVSFGDNADMGTCTLTLYKSEDKIAYVKADAQVGKVADTVVALLGKQTINNSSRPAIPNYFYLGAAAGENKIKFGSVTGLYFDQGEAAVRIEGTGETAPKIEENIYSQRPLHFRGHNTAAGRISVTGSVFSTKSVFLRGYVTINGDLASQETVTFENEGNSEFNLNGNIEARTVEIEDNRVVAATGVETTTFTLRRGASFTGSVRATTVTLGNGAKITGNVECDILTIGSSASVTGNAQGNTVSIANGGSVTGDLQFNTVTIAGQGNPPAVNGQVSCVTMSIGGTSYPTIESLIQRYPNDTWKAIVTNNITYVTGAYTAPEISVELEIPAPSVPGFGSADNLEAAMVSPFNSTLGNDQGDDSYYVLSEGEKINHAKLTVKGTGNIFLYITDKAELTIDDIDYDQTFNKEAPTLYIVVDDDCDLRFDKKVAEFYGYVYCRHDGESKDLPHLKIENDNFSVIGGLFFDGIKDDSDVFVKGLKIKYIGSQGFGGGDGEGTSREQWYVRQYLNSLPQDLEG